MNATDRPKGRDEGLTWLASAQAEEDLTRLLRPYLDAAAVLCTFQLRALRPAGDVEGITEEEALMELLNFARPVPELGPDIWQLDVSTRRDALRRMGDRAALQRARAANPQAGTDGLQRMFDRLINDAMPPDLDGLTLDELLDLERAMRWLEGILSPLPAHSDLLARIERARLIAPMRRLAGEGFMDRESYREHLAAHVGVLPPDSLWQGLWRRVQNIRYLLKDRPPLHLYGPGGVGKSALLARFVLDHADPKAAQPIPFVYLDFDRVVLDPRKPETLVEEAIRQLLVQFPQVDAELISLNAQARETRTQLESIEISKSAHFDALDALIGRFARLLRTIAERNDQPVLMVLDTLEEAAFQGHSALIVTWDLLEQLLSQVSSLRIVTAGRARLPDDLPCIPLELTDLPEEAAIALLVQRTAKASGGPLSATDARTIVSLVGRIPLSLALAARVCLNEGIADLRDAVRSGPLFTSIASEQQQGMLYGRILAHVRAHHPGLEKVASPGLVLRRITPDIIQHVLAGPCGLDMRRPGTADKLFDALTREAGLVEADREPGALWHLPAVRRIMLPQLRALLGPQAQAIHAAAAQYYASRTAPVERAEGIYHLLWLGADTKELEDRWSDDLAPYLRSAYEEMDAGAKVWLADKLGIELDAELRRQADQGVWERQAVQRARTLLASGLVDQALHALQERPHPEEAGALSLLEADVLKLMGRLEEARAVVARALPHAERANDPHATMQLLLREALLAEAQGRYLEMLGTLQRTFLMALRLGQPLEILSAGLAYLRGSRKLNAEPPPGITERLIEVLSLSDVRTELRQRPALLQEAAAELGERDIPLLTEAVAVTGITPDDLLALAQYVRTTKSTAANEALELLDRLSAMNTSRGVGAEAARLVPAFAAFFAQRLAYNVEDALQRVVRPRTSQRTDTFTLSSAQLRTLGTLIVHAFDARELELLVLDTFDLPLGKLVDPGAPLAVIVERVLDYARHQSALPLFITRLARSRPDDPAWKAFAASVGISA